MSSGGFCQDGEGRDEAGGPSLGKKLGKTGGKKDR